VTFEQRRAALMVFELSGLQTVAGPFLFLTQSGHSLAQASDRRALTATCDVYIEVGINCVM